MSGRIRTLKPEWLDDELLARSSSDARVLSVGLILMADDYGNGRGSAAAIASQVWAHAMVNDGENAPEVFERAKRATEELVAARFVELYSVDGQTYFHIRNWEKHQRVDKPGKPRVPKPPAAAPASHQAPRGRAGNDRVGYFIRGAVTGLIKIGSSADPVSRLAELARAGSEPLELLAVGGEEAAHHRALADSRVHGEWFRASPAVLAKVREHGGDPASPLAVAGYSQTKPTLEVRSQETSRDVRAEFAPDPDPISDPDHDPDRERRARDGAVAESEARALGFPPSLSAPDIRDKLATAWRRGYVKRFERACAVTHRGPEGAHLATLIDTAAAQADPHAFVEKALSGFFADDWAVSARFPIKNLAANAERYASSPKPRSKPRDKDPDKYRPSAEWVPDPLPSNVVPIGDAAAGLLASLGLKAPGGTT